MTTTNILTINNLNMHFGGIKALNDVSLEIPHNKITAIIGPNGAGKTTLFNCVTGFYTPNDGDIHLIEPNTRLNTLLGEKISFKELLNLKNLHKNLTKIYYQWFGGAHLLTRLGISRTFQNIRLFPNMSVIENLLVAQHIHLNKNVISGLFNFQSYVVSEQTALATAIKWLEICGLIKYGNDLAGSLSYGHQRLLEIARAMCTKPKIICLDEPAAGLNAAETENLCVLLRKLCQEHNITVLLIEHDMNLIMKISEKIYVLDHGSVIACGTPEEIRSNPQVISAYLGG